MAAVTMALACAAMPHGAGAQIWTGLWDESGDLMMLGTCATAQNVPGALQPACLSFHCWWDGGLAMQVVAGGAVTPAQVGATVTLDGTPAMTVVLDAETLRMNGAAYHFLSTRFDRASMEGLFQRMTGAARMGLSFDEASLNQPGLAAVDLAGFGAALVSFRDECFGPSEAAAVPADPPPAPGLTGAAEPDPRTAPGRFIDIETISHSGAEEVRQARVLAAAAISEAENALGGPIEVRADRVPFADGRELLFIRLCHPTYFGITGCDTHLWYRRPSESAFRFDGHWIGGGPYWLDLQSATNGWFDMISQPYSARGAYVRNTLGNLGN